MITSAVLPEKPGAASTRPGFGPTPESDTRCTAMVHAEVFVVKFNYREKQTARVQQLPIRHGWFPKDSKLEITYLHLTSICIKSGFTAFTPPRLGAEERRREARVSALGRAGPADGALT